MTDTSEEQYLVEKLAGTLEYRLLIDADTGKTVLFVYANVDPHIKHILRDETYEEWKARKEQE